VSKFKQYWHYCWEKKLPKWLLGIPLGGLLLFVLGAGTLGGFQYTLSVTNTQEFCLSCHEMNDNLYEDLKLSVHYSNASGVQATCIDCHVPKEFLPKMHRKMRATLELYHSVVGTIDTPEKFEAHRWAMAQSVWQEMRDNDSRECRSCHSMERMNKEAQSKMAARKHDPEKLAASGKTCIDCHKGVAHKLPTPPTEAKEPK